MIDQGIYAELNAREIDGVRVRLLWHRGTNRTMIEYVDSFQGNAWMHYVPNDVALDAFHHPNAYHNGELVFA